jgi:hypothetical protein
MKESFLKTEQKSDKNDSVCRLQYLGSRGLLKKISFVCSKIRVKWIPVTTALRILRLRVKGGPPAMEGSCEYIE